jgi:hypothetical protein
MSARITPSFVNGVLTSKDFAIRSSNSQTYEPKQGNLKRINLNPRQPYRTFAKMTLAPSRH